MALDFQIFGQGIYTPKQAARLIEGKSADVQRWTRGSGTTEPLWESYFQYLDDAAELSFIDLIEVRVVNFLRRHGISLQQIRFAMGDAKVRFGKERPLSTLEFKTDGAEILVKSLENPEHLVSLSPKRLGQTSFRRIIEQSLKDVEYENNEIARWRPSFAQGIIIDPTRKFGEPILDEFGVSTAQIYREFNYGQDVSEIASYYEIPQKCVKTAISYEARLDKNQKA